MSVHHINHCEKCIDSRQFSIYLVDLFLKLNDIRGYILRFDLKNGSYKYSLKSTHFSRQFIHLSAFKVDPILSSQAGVTHCVNFVCLSYLSLHFSLLPSLTTSGYYRCQYISFDRGGPSLYRPSLQNSTYIRLIAETEKRKVNSSSKSSALTVC